MSKHKKLLLGLLGILTLLAIGVWGLYAVLCSDFNGELTRFQKLEEKSQRAYPGNGRR